jgi:ubiquitin C-terminal hydrolase
MFNDLMNNEYHLFGVFVHEGCANFGHYWQYLYDIHDCKWLKYNDSMVTVVSEDLIFQDTTGRTYGAFSLVYVKTEELKKLTSPFVRNEYFRNYYKDDD